MSRGCSGLSSHLHGGVFLLDRLLLEEAGQDVGAFSRRGLRRLGSAVDCIDRDVAVLILLRDLRVELRGGCRLRLLCGGGLPAVAGLFVLLFPDQLFPLRHGRLRPEDRLVKAELLPGSRHRG